MPYVQSGTATVHFRTSALPGPTLVLAHGFLMDESMFEPMRKPLADAGINLVTVDARGHGRTRAPLGERFSYWDLAADMLAVLDSMNIERAVIGGMSQGGFAAMRLALAAPHRVRGLALMSTEAGDCSPAELAWYRVFFERWHSDEPIAPLIAELAPQLIGGHDPRAWREWTVRWNDSDRSALRAAAQCLMDRRSLTHRLAEITVPALVLRGSHDGTSTAQKSEAMVAGLSGADGVVTIPGAGHGATWTHPELVAPLLIRLVERAVHEERVAKTRGIVRTIETAPTWTESAAASAGSPVAISPTAVAI
ncbi:alpha/beta hydrolase [Nocardia uniformis]|uniref:Alpha/beta hydrolase n=1 Tax=Nocardia uniformis TaxID=53432 RepID=A0A849C198_9NOCA|nr:alpha/beta hydrolase [Nocardia uniformis]NNH69617.1 alpha/beta hydrolase [Nocardia uniformis]